MRLARVIYHKLAKKYHYNISQNMDLYEHHRKLYHEQKLSSWEKRRFKRAIGWTLLAAVVLAFFFGIPAAIAITDGVTYAAALLEFLAVFLAAFTIFALICLIIWLID